MKNPFIIGQPITDPKDFYDREKELKEIFSDVRNQHNISLIGERKIGKTSLLNMVCHPGKMREHGINTGKTLIISIDSSEVEKGDPTSVWKSLLSPLLKEIRDENIEKELKGKINSDQIGMSALQRALSCIEKNVVVIFDEFEAICEDMDIDFFQDLRYLAQTTKLTYIVSTCKDLLTLTKKDKRIASSPFFNIFIPQLLGLFGKDQSREFISSKFEKRNIQEKHIDLILQICGPHPFFLQLFCSYLFDSLNNESGSSVEQGLEQAEMQFMESSNIHFRYFWDRFDSVEAKALLDMALDKKINDHLKNVLHGLERRGFIIRDKKTYEIFSRAFKQWIFENMEEMERSNPFMKILAFAALLIVAIFFFWIAMNLILT